VTVTACVAALFAMSTNGVDVTTNLLGAAGVTAMVLVVTVVTAAFEPSVAVIVYDPAVVSSSPEKVARPLFAVTVLDPAANEPLDRDNAMESLEGETVLP
jgi:hypothetical protein